jgi:gamma-glutamyltranspeptidase/glutathione hydrolase
MRKFTWIVVALVVSACAGKPPDDRAAVDAAAAEAAFKNGMVSTAHPLATDAGLSILGAGGNAFDAAVAIAATL